MSKYIDADRLMAILAKRCDEADNQEAWFAYARACGDVRDLPAADVAEVRHGRWIVKHGVMEGDGIYGDMGECSVCDLHLRNYEWNYCPNCGTRMEGEEEWNHYQEMEK